MCVLVPGGGDANMQNTLTVFSGGIVPRSILSSQKSSW